jgi:hypothetical protein
MPKNRAEDILARFCANFPHVLAGAMGKEDHAPVAEWFSNELFGLLGGGSQLEFLLIDRSERGTPLDEHGDYVNWKPKKRKKVRDGK